MRSAVRLKCAKSLQVPRSETAGRLAVQLAKALDGVCALSAERGHGVAGQSDLPRAEDLGVAGQDLLDERRAGSRQPHDEHRQFAFQPKAADPLEEIRRADRDHLGDERLVLFRVVLLAALAPLGQLQRVAPIEVLGGLGILAPRVQDLGQAEVQQQSLCVRQLRFLQQAALRGQILLRKFAAQEFRQFVMREGEPGIVPQRGAEAVFRALKIADLLQSAAQVAVRLGIVRLQFQCPAVAGDRFVQLPLLLQGSAQVVVRLGKVRLQFQCPAAAGDRFVQLPLLLQGIAQVVVCLGIVRLQFQCPAVAGDRFVQLPLVLQCIAQVVVRLGIVRLQFQCPAEAGDRFVQLPLVLQRNAQVVVCLGIVRLQFQCPAEAGDRFVQLPLVL